MTVRISKSLLVLRTRLRRFNLCNLICGETDVEVYGVIHDSQNNQLFHPPPTTTGAPRQNRRRHRETPPEKKYQRKITESPATVRKIPSLSPDATGTTRLSTADIPAISHRQLKDQPETAFDQPSPPGLAMNLLSHPEIQRLSALGSHSS